MSNFKLMTLFSDASHCPQTLAAGWGAWARGDGWERGEIFGGPILLKPKNSGEAELIGLVSALHYVITNQHLKEEKAIVLQCDSTEALGLILKLPNARFTKGKGSLDVQRVIARTTPHSKLMRDTLKYAETLTKGLTLWGRHVKGHNSGDGRSWVSRQCDATAKQFMNQVRSNQCP